MRNHERLPDTTFALLLEASCRQQDAALDAGDTATVDAFASATADLLGWHLHRAGYWRCMADAAADDVARLQRDITAWGGTAA